jgi:hypothetical protein
MTSVLDLAPLSRSACCTRRSSRFSVVLMHMSVHIWYAASNRDVQNRIAREAPPSGRSESRAPAAAGYRRVHSLVDRIHPASPGAARPLRTASRGCATSCYLALVRACLVLVIVNEA